MSDFQVKSSVAALQQQRRGVQQCPHGPRVYNLGLQMGQRCSRSRSKAAAAAARLRRTTLGE